MHRSDSQRLFLGMLTVANVIWATCGAPSVASAQTKIVVGFAAGSGVDVIARIVGARLQGIVGEPVIIENRPGAGGRIAAQVTINADPDGKTMLLAPIVTTAFTPFMYAKPGYDALKDLLPITRLGNFKFALAVNNNLPASSVKDFAAYATKNPGTVTYATPGIGTPAHFLGVMFNRAIGTDLLHVPYKGSGPAATALLSGEVLSTFNTTVALIPLGQSQKVKLLAVTGASRSPAMRRASPTVPGR